MRAAPFLICAAIATAFGGCTSARVTATLEGEPVCPDFELGAAHAKFKGALKRPVKITVLDGKTVLSERVDLGKRTAEDKPGLLVVQDSNQTYKVRFAQCANEFAPHPIDTAEKDPKHKDERTNYNCGDAKVYQEIEIKVRTGHPETRVITWQTPPDTECLTTKIPAAASAAAPAREPR